MSFTIDKEIAEKFNEITAEKFINKSELVESFIRKWVKENFKK